MDAAPVIDLTNAAQVALTRMLDTGRVIGRDETGRKVIAVAVEDWIVDRFTSPGTLSSDRQACPKEGDLLDRVESGSRADKATWPT
jgi:hypothetical protein